MPAVAHLYCRPHFSIHLNEYVTRLHQTLGVFLDNCILGHHHYYLMRRPARYLMHHHPLLLMKYQQVLDMDSK